MKINKLLQKMINKLADESFKDGRMIESRIARSIKLLKVKSKPQAIVSLSEYLREIKRKQGEHTLYIESVIVPSAKQLYKLKKFAEKRIKITKIITGINPEILGGFKLKVGDEIWDASVRGKIEQIRKAIVS